MSIAKTTRGQKKKFTISEDALLRSLVKKYGENNWERVTEFMCGRNVRQCKDRWEYYLSPKVNNSPWTEEEEAKLVQHVNELGPRWVKISKLFPGRTDTQIKNKWNVLKRRMEADVPIPIPPVVLESKTRETEETQEAQPVPILYQTAILKHGFQNMSINNTMLENEDENETFTKDQAFSVQFLSEEQFFDPCNDGTEEYVSEVSCNQASFVQNDYADDNIPLSGPGVFFLRHDDSTFDFFA